MRVKAADLTAHGELEMRGVTTPGQSMTRSWRAKAEDCLYPTNPGEPIDKYQNFGIARFEVTKIPRAFIANVFVPDGKKMKSESQSWAITPTHVPLFNLYCHCEVRLNRQGQAYNPELQAARTVRSEFRRQMQIAYQDICQRPQV